MTAMKKIYLDSRFIGEVPDGDDETVAAAAADLMRSKGLYEPPTLVQAMFLHAHAFAETSSYLYSNGIKKWPRSAQTAAPFVVNGVFALELYIKTLAAIYGRSLRGHDLIKLFDAMPNEARASLSTQFQSAKWQCGIDTLDDLRESLAEIRKAFEEWRYVYERAHTGAVKFEALIFALEVFHNTCKTYPEVRRNVGGSSSPP